MKKIVFVLILLVLISACSPHPQVPPSPGEESNTNAAAAEALNETVEDSLNEELIPENEDIEIGDMI